MEIMKIYEDNYLPRTHSIDISSMDFIAGIATGLLDNLHIFRRVCTEFMRAELVFVQQRQFGMVVNIICALPKIAGAESEIEYDCSTKRACVESEVDDGILYILQKEAVGHNLVLRPKWQCCLMCRGSFRGGRPETQASLHFQKCDVMLCNKCIKGITQRAWNLWNACKSVITSFVEVQENKLRDGHK